jgi:MoxR-like ATPase
MPSGPERLIPYHLGNEPESVQEARAEEQDRVNDQIEAALDKNENLTADELETVSKKELASQRREQYHLRKDELRRAPGIEVALKAEAEKHGWSEEKIAATPWRLRAVEDFQKIAREAQVLRKSLKKAADPIEKLQMLRLYKDRQEKLNEYVEGYGLSFEAAYREYIAARRKYFDFMKILDDIRKLENILAQPSFRSLDKNEPIPLEHAAKLERLMRSKGEIASDDSVEKQDLLDSLASIYEVGSPEYKEAERTLLGEVPLAVPQSKKEIIEQLKELKEEAGDMWSDDSMVRYFYNKFDLDKLLKDFTEGKDVIETQSVVQDLNKLHEWEQVHQRTTIGGVLVGPPGTGKTTRVHHYLEAKGRSYVYIDLSEDVTRYMLYGSKSISFKSPTEYFQTLLSDLNRLEDDGSFDDFIRANAQTFQATFGLEKDEATVVALQAIVSELDSDAAPEEIKKYTGPVKEKILGLARQKLHAELGTQFGKLVSSSKNGWRDGVIIAALRRGDSILFDEFTKNKNWSLIYGLMTAKPGEKWYFADNDEYIEIPDEWRMYFTGNIGRKHGGFEVPEALASRAQGKTLEVEYTPPREEMQIALIALANPEGIFLRSSEDLAKLYWTIFELFPKIRKFTEDERQIIPISNRTIRDLGEKLVQYKDPVTRAPIYRPTDIDFDEALYDILIESYSQYESKKIPEQIVKLATAQMLLLSDSVKDKVIGWIGEDLYNERRATRDSNKESFEEITKKIQGMKDSADTMEDVMAAQTKF